MSTTKFSITREDLLKSKRLEASWYKVKFKAPYTKVQKDTGSAGDGQTQFYVEMLVIGGPNQKDGSSPIGTTLTRVYFENSMGDLRNLLQALGTKIPDEGTTGDLAGIKDRECQAFVKNELDRKGKMRNIVEEFQP